MRTAVTLLLWTSLAGGALAQDCYPWSILLEPEAAELYLPADGEVHFYRNAEDAPGCPAAEECRRRAYIVPGDIVAATEPENGFMCALYIGTDAKHTMTAGWVREDDMSWYADEEQTATQLLGRWQYGEFHELTIEPGSRAGELVISGEALFGADDPERVAMGGINVGTLEDVTIEAETEDIAFTVDWDGVVGPYDPDGEFCAIRIFLKGPYLAVVDNGRCGGQNVTFGGLYSASP
jgi:hypothetical protein